MRAKRLWRAVALATTAIGGASGAAPNAKVCCFTNPDFVGTCRVTAAKRETCDSILRYLNDAKAVGKTYCDNTTIRGGWVAVSCTDGKIQ